MLSISSAIVTFVLEKCTHHCTKLIRYVFANGRYDYGDTCIYTIELILVIRILFILAEIT